MIMMRRMTQSFIVLFSEIIWIYYTIVLFSDRLWAKGIVSDVMWWIIAAAAGYALHKAFAGKVHFLLSSGISAAVVALLVYLNWQASVPAGEWGYGLAVSFALGFVFIRSAGFVYRQPVRMTVLGHFEANIILYILFLLLFTAKQWLDGSFHAVFLTGIFVSLMGMILTLQSSDAAGSNNEADVRTVGQSGWFAGVIVLLVGGMALLCFLLLLPSVREGLYTAAVAAWGGIVWLAQTLVRFLMWILSLLPRSEPGEIGPLPGEGAGAMPGAPQEEQLPEIPVSWIIGTLSVIGIGVAAIAVTLFLKYWKPPRMSMRAHRVTISRESWWNILRRRMAAWASSFRRRWRSRFPRFYLLEIYWLYYRVEAWGKKQGIRKLPAETTKEYIEKLIRQLPDPAAAAESLRLLNRSYQAAYYGQQTGVLDDEALHRQLQQLLTHLKKK